MKLLVKCISFLCLLFCTSFSLAQEREGFLNSEKRFTVRGSVIESDTNKPIPNVNIEVSGGAYTTTDALGEFRIVAKKGDELIVKHKDFETVYYIIKSSERIKVEVEPNKTDDLVNKKLFKFISFTFSLLGFNPIF